MGSIETIIRQGRDGETVKYRGVPWDAIQGRKGPTKSFPTSDAAYAYVRAWEARNDGTAAAAGLAVERRVRRVTVAEYARTYALTAPGERNTKRDRLSTSRRIGHELAGLHLDELTRHVVAKWDSDNADNMSPGTRRKRVGFLSQMCRSAIRDGYMRENPCDDLPRAPRVNVNVKTVPSEFEAEQIIRWVPAYLKVTVLLAASSGMRAGEICGLKWKNVDLRNSRVCVRDVRLTDGTIRPYTKGKTHRTVPLSPRTVQALKAHKEFVSSGPEDFVACNKSFEPLRTHWLASMWPRLMRRYSAMVLQETGRLVTPPRFHDLRHYAVHDLVGRGVHVRVLQGFLGHKDLNTTQVYMPEATVEAMASAMAAPRRALQTA